MQLTNTVLLHRGVLIDNQWLQATGNNRFLAYNPAGESEIIEVANGSTKETEEAIKVAAEVFHTRSILPAKKRSSIFKKQHSLFIDNSNNPTDMQPDVSGGAQARINTIAPRVFTGLHATLPKLHPGF